MLSVVATNLEEQVSGGDGGAALGAAGGGRPRCRTVREHCRLAPFPGQVQAFIAQPAFVKLSSRYASNMASAGRRCLQWRMRGAEERPRHMLSALMDCWPLSLPLMPRAGPGGGAGSRDAGGGAVSGRARSAAAPHARLVGRHGGPQARGDQKPWWCPQPCPSAGCRPLWRA